MFARDGLGQGDTLTGPAVVDEWTTTTIVPPGWTLTVHASGTLIMTRAV
ncbi:hypothetical protein [Kineobactrum salinum]